MRQALRLIPAARPRPLDGKPVLESAPLRRGYRRSALSRFEDSSWDLSPAVFRENARQSQNTVYFDAIEDAGVERTLREFLYARLNFDVPGFRMRLPPVSIRGLFNRSRCFLEFAADKNGTCDLGRVDQTLLDAYLAHLTADRQYSSNQIARLLEVIMELHYFREHMPSGGIELLPWKGRSSSTIAGWKQTGGENKTQRLPEEIISPLLKWSLKYVTVFSADILAARVELEAMQQRRKQLISEDAPFSMRVRRQRRCERLIAYIEQLRANGRGVPIWTTDCGVFSTDPSTGTITPPVNAVLLHLHVGIDPAKSFGHVLTHKATKQLVLKAIAELGVETGGMDTPISDDPDTGLAWRPRFDSKTLLLEEKMLQAACYIVCAYLTGMRDAEVQAMRLGCLEARRSEDGVIERYRVKSTVYKGRDSRGQAETWTTIEPVAKAIRVLEQLTERVRKRRGGDTLWRMLNDSHSGEDHISVGILLQLNTFRDHLNTHFSPPDAPIIPSGPDGKPWRITTRQFRRTVAWHIANRPFGTVAGMIQYKHASIAAYEGYAGSSRSGFRNEVERERALGQLDDVLSYFERRRIGEVLMGPAAARISNELQQAVDKLAPLPGHIADPARVRAMLAHVAKTLFVGVMNDCFFDPATALCLKGKGQAAVPAMAQCRPDRCPNSCIASHHRPLWAKAIADGEALLRTRRLSPLQQEAIEVDLKRYRNVLKPAKESHVWS
jgi:integrase